MSDNEIPEINREFGTIMRVGVQAATRLAERAARSREVQRRHAQDASEANRRSLEAAFTAERAHAETTLSRIHHDQWWDRTGPGAIADHYHLARSWENESSAAHAAAREMEQRLRQRYGIDATERDHREINALLRSAQDDIAQAAQEDQQAARNNLTASQLMEHAERADRGEAPAEAEQHRERADSEWDSAERREAFAREMRAAGIDDQTTAARLQADLDQATHPAAAVAGGGPRRAPKARKGSSSPSQTPERAISSR
ncbi:hypothetical protein [Rhodococcus rhodnii]|uniref:hypothetical protein n=1 Tax=Rhodococcus rhodnii TaxID=38312 RepID=UPI0009351426|nr:hypothetical protein [Rhodococcus rhodnii]